MNSEVERRVLFSVWDAVDGEAATCVDKCDLVTKIDHHPDTTVQKFGGEGTGLQSIFKCMWTTGDEYRFRAEAEPNAEKRETIYSGYLWLDDKWTLISRLCAPADGRYLTGVYSFIENWESDRSCRRACEYYGQRYQRKSTGDKFYEVTACTTTHTDRKLVSCMGFFC